MNKLPDCAFLDECFELRDGVLYWRERPAHHFQSMKGASIFNSSHAGKPAGTFLDGYTSIILRDRGKKMRYLAHRIIWKMVNGRDPMHEIDHIDCDKANSRPENLREATGSQNGINTKKRADNTSGYKGVARHALTKKWRAFIGVDGKQSHIGYFDTPEAAHAAYMEAAVAIYGEFAKSG